MPLDTAVAEQFEKALTSTGEELMILIQQASPEIIQTALRNRALDENHLLEILGRQDLAEEQLKRICHLNITESSHKVKLAVARHKNTPPHELLKILPHLYLFELLNFCLLVGIAPDQKLAAERTIIQRLPMTPLGNKLTLARRATPLILEALLKEGDPRLIEICLLNPKLKEGALFQFLRSGAATAETISLVARNPRWQNKPNIREAILSNPKTPLIWFTLWLSGMKTTDLNRLITSNRLTIQQKNAVNERLKR